MALTTNLNVYYKLDGNSNEAVGGTLNGTDTAITYSAGNGIIVQGAGFNGTTSKIVFTDNASFKPTGNFSVNMWLKMNSNGTGGTLGLFQSYAQPGTVAGFAIEQYNTTNKLRFYSGKNTGVTLGTDFQDLTSASAISSAAFQMWTMVYNGSNLLIYLNGNSTPDASVAWTNGPAYAATNYVRMGCADTAGTDGSFNSGAIDEVGLWSRALSTSEISQLYNGGAGFQYPFVTSTTGAAFLLGMI